MIENSYQGYEVRKHRAIMTGKMCFQIAVGCLLAQLLLLVVLIDVMVPRLHRELALKWPLARLQQLMSVNGVFRLRTVEEGRLPAWPRNSHGVVEVTARELVRNVSYRRVFTSKEAHWGWAIACSFPAWLFWPVVIRFFHIATAKIKDNEHIRGAELITEEEIRAQTDGTGILFIGRIRIPESVSRRHLLIAGQTGSGKSTILIQHLAAIQNSKRRAIVNDFKGDLVERFYRPHRDLILNPLDSRGLGWTLFNELDSIPDLTAIAGSLIPQAKGEERFWSAAAQDVFRGLMAFCYQYGRLSNAQLWKAVTSTIKEIADMCQSTTSGRAGYSYIQDASSKQADGVIAVLMSYVSWLEFATDGTFSGSNPATQYRISRLVRRGKLNRAAWCGGAAECTLQTPLQT